MRSECSLSPLEMSGATFLEEILEPDNSLDQLLDRPREAFQEIFGDCSRNPEVSETQWRTQVINQKSGIAGLCVWTSSSRGIVEILGEILTSVGPC